MGEEKVRVRPERLRPLVHEGRTYKATDDFSLTKETIETAFLELTETEDVRISALKALKDKINCDQSLRYRTDEDFLLRFLRHCKFDVDKAYSSLRNFYELRKTHAYAFSLSHVEQMLDTHFCTYLPYRDGENCLVFWTDFRKFSLDEGRTVWDIMSAYHVVAEIIGVNPNVQICGVKTIWDFRGINSQIIRRFLSPTVMLTFFKLYQETYPWRYKKIVLIHSSYALQIIYNGIRYFLKKKIRDRIVFLGSDISELHQHHDLAILPKEYGGTLEEDECYITEHIMENMNYIKYERSFGHV